jgi:L-rhamnose mutarotase
MERMGLCNRLRPEKAEEYKGLHAAACPACLRRSPPATFRSFSIFFASRKCCCSPIGNITVWISLPTQMAADPVTRDWWNFTDPCQEPYETLADRTWWADMTSFPPSLSFARGAGAISREPPLPRNQTRTRADRRARLFAGANCKRWNERGFDWSRDRSGGNFGFGRTPSDRGAARTRAMRQPESERVGC